ncbi:MAG TPA: hypothetical protein VJN89_08000 [Candidatus Acidoferrum sp.]|nr:hypothetical protein [Candidatus Acidoferrum sp.]
MKWIEPRLLLLRYLSVLVVGLSLLATALAVIALLVSFVRPEWDTMRLLEMSTIAFRVGFGSIFAAIGAGAGLSYLLRPKGELSSRFEKQFARYRAALKVIVAAAGLLMAVTLIQGFTFVKVSANKWISTSRAGSHEVSGIMAREYFWRIIRFSSLFLVVSSSVLGFESTGILRVLGSACESDPNSEAPPPAG